MRLDDAEHVKVVPLPGALATLMARIEAKYRL
jgi:hypothetical protein